MEQFMHNIMQTSLLSMTLGAWLTLAIFIVLYISLIKQWMTATVSLLLCAILLLCFGIVDDEQFMEVLGSEPVLVHFAFFIIIAGMVRTGGFYWLSQHLLGKPKSYGTALVRLMVPSSIMSMAMGSINVTALYIDMIKIWSRSISISPSRLLLPLSYATVFGGLCTLLGSSANLIVATLYTDNTGRSMALFAPFIPGFIVGSVGLILVLALRRLIPSRKEPEESFESTSDYTVELLVPTDNEAVGMTVGEAGLKDVNGGSLVEIVRFDKEVITPVPADEFILGGDRLVYSGLVNEILNLKKTRGLVAANHHVYNVNELSGDRVMRTAYVTYGSKLIGTRMSDNGFEDSHKMVLVAIARQGHRVDGLPRDIVIEAGDSLLFECPKDTDSNLMRDNETKRMLRFFDSNFVPRRDKKTFVSTAILSVVLLLSLFQVMSLLAATMLGAALMLITRCCRYEKITEYVEWDVLLLLGCIMVFSTAINNSHLGEFIAGAVVNLLGGNTLVVLTVMCLAAGVVSEFINSAAVAAIFFPIFYHQAVVLGVNPEAFAIALMLSVGTSLSSPIGCIPNMLIYGAGGFRFSDFARLGVPIHAVLLVVSIATVTLIYGLV